MIQKIDINELGIMVSEWKDGKPWSSIYDGLTAARQIAEKVNEIITEIHIIERILNIEAEVNQVKSIK